MKIALIGATGYVGSKILAEALTRGHQVTAISKKIALALQEGKLTLAQVDAAEVAALTEVLRGHDVVISAFNPALENGTETTAAIIAATKAAGVKRLLAVGGAGTLLLANGERVVDQADFPAEWKAGALKTADFLAQLRAETALDWVSLSPAANLVPGERTGKFQIGSDYLLTDAKGDSRISLEDYAVAMLDEAEKPAHHQERFTVAY